MAKARIFGAVWKGNVALVRKLLKEGTDLEKRDSVSGHTPLLSACIRSPVEIVKMLIEAGANMKARTHFGDTPLLIATAHNNPKVVKALLEAGADLESRNVEHRSTPLITAAFWDRANTLSVLLKAGANKKARNKEGESALDIACVKGHLKIVGLLIDAGQTVEDRSIEEQQDLLEKAAAAGDLALLKKLFGSHVEPDGRKGWANLLGKAATGGHRKVVLAMLKAGAKIDAKSGSGETALLAAVSYDQLQIVLVLLESGADPDRDDKYGVTPLIWAARLGHQDIVEALLKAGADAAKKDKNGWTARTSATDKAILKMLPAKKGLKKPRKAEQRGYVLCEECAMPANWLPDLKKALTMDSYCRECGAHYCHRHFPVTDMGRVAAGVDAELIWATCPKGHHTHQ